MHLTEAWVPGDQRRQGDTRDSPDWDTLWLQEAKKTAKMAAKMAKAKDPKIMAEKDEELKVDTARTKTAQQLTRCPNLSHRTGA